MDAYEATRIVFSRIKSLEPENVSKIMGYLLLQDHGEQEMIRLAFSPESLIQSLIVKAKKDLGLIQQQGSPSVQSYLSRINRQNLPLQPLQISQVSSRVFPSPNALSPHAPPWGSSHINSPQARTLPNNFHVHPNELHPNATTTNSVSVSSTTSNGTNNGYLNFSLPDQVNKLPLIYNMEHPHGLADSEFQMQDQLSYLTDSSDSPNSHSNYLSYPDMLAYYSGNQLLSMDHMNQTASNGVGPKRLSSIADICNIGVSTPDSAGGSTTGWKPCMYYARGYCKNGDNCRFLHGGSNRGESAFSDEVVGSSNGSLEKIELEFQELLRGRRSPISLPQLFGERFGKTLQAEISPRWRSERELDRSLAPANPGSRQIYLTFPAESTFKEEDVSNYFSIFGPVQDVRIPYQQKRMFGFVTFVYQETVRAILAKGNPHYVCDARVLVKPYREKGSKSIDRKYSSYITTQNMDIRDCNLHLGPPRLIESSNSDVMRRQLEEQELEQAIEIQARRLAELQLADRQGPQISATPKKPTPSHENHLSNGPNHSEEEATASEDISSSAIADHFAYLLQVLDSEPGYEERPIQIDRPTQIDHHQDRCPIPNGAIRM